jgi:hypothetical protein
MISPHTLELSMEMDNDTFYHWRDEVKNKKKYCPETNKDFSLVEDGITVWFYKTKFKKWIKLLINPSRMLGFDDLLELWEPCKKNTNKLLSKLEENIDEYFDSAYELNDFKLSRIDFTKNVRFGSKEKVSAYIKILYNIRKVKGFSPKYSKNDWYDENLSFDLEGNSNGIDFTAYDKAGEIKASMGNDESLEFRRKKLEDRLQKAKGILRFEVKLTTQKAIRSYTDEESTIGRIINLSKNSRKIFMDTFLRVVPFGDFYKKDYVVKIIEENVTDAKLKNKMLRFLELIPKKKSLYLARKEMNDRNIERVESEFHHHNLSPITISKRHDVKHLKSFYTFF